MKNAPRRLTSDQEAELKAWRDNLPPKVQAVFDKYPPNTLYRLDTSKTHHQVVFITAYDEPDNSIDPVTVKVFVSSIYNTVVFERQVFGIRPEKLSPATTKDISEAGGGILGEIHKHEKENID